MLRWLIEIILGEIICESSNWQYTFIQRLKITFLGATGNFMDWKGLPNVHILVCLQKNIKFYWFVMQIKKFMLPIWWYNRGWFPLGNKYWGLRTEWVNETPSHTHKNDCKVCIILMWRPFFCLSADEQHPCRSPAWRWGPFFLLGRAGSLSTLSTLLLRATITEWWGLFGIHKLT